MRLTPTDTAVTTHKPVTTNVRGAFSSAVCEQRCLLQHTARTLVYRAVTSKSRLKNPHQHGEGSLLTLSESSDYAFVCLAWLQAGSAAEPEVQ